MFFIWAAIFFVIAIVAAALGFTDIAAKASEVARILFYISLAIFLLLVFSGFILFRKVRSVTQGLGFKENWRGLLRKIN